MKLLSSFDRAYVINLPERTDRRQEMFEELQHAAVGEASAVRFFPAIRPSTQGTFESIPVRGCFMSHLEVLREAVRDRLQSVLIMEDDLHISRRLTACQEQIAQRLALPDWDLCYFGHNLPFPMDERPQLIAYTERVILQHFYAVRGDCIAQLVEFLELVASRPYGHPDGGPMPVDGAIWTFRAQNTHVRTLVARPNLGTQRSSRSDITPSRLDSVAALRPLLDTARRMRRAVLGRR